MLVPGLVGFSRFLDVWICCVLRAVVYSLSFCISCLSACSGSILAGFGSPCGFVGLWICESLGSHLLWGWCNTGFVVFWVLVLWVVGF